ncbi:signal peptidase II [Psychrobacter sp. FDAARGOS_221]|uniref:signal peptidase II n=1 Tax=Psychrobacter sp. FDAARGOS_221 TaxID=1975705 RepID=UPI000BB59A56|nr:signal peptidase II [Psychrobacter sp. FDAARGOS_221]PNK61269.1 lipoprotein signal peptidase [Psychrobacter sp. FDAARGOS_221]
MPNPANPESRQPDPSTTKPAYVTPEPSPNKRPKLIPNGRQALLWYVLSLIAIGLDQWTKWLADTRLNFHDPIPVIEPYLNWTLAYNYGAAFSFLADQGGWQKWFFASLSFVMSLFLLVYLTRAPRQAKLLNVGLALILGGAVGNLIDRVRIGKVIDFIHVHYADVWHYPIFNVADIAICTGVALVIIDMLFFENKRNIQYQKAN